MLSDNYCCDTVWDNICEQIAQQECKSTATTTMTVTDAPTDKPTIAPTIAPTDAPTIGCIQSCSDITDGNYVSCNHGCDYYLQCCNGLEKLHKCPDGLLFHINKQECDFEANVHCTSETSRTPEPEPAPNSQPPAATEYDNYGIKKLYQSIDSSLDFYPNWMNAPSREFRSVKVDPDSTNNLCYARGSSSTFNIDGTNGIMTVNGNTPRYYCYVDNLNTEITTYAKRGKETQYKSYAGFTIGARSDHKNYKSNKCDARGYYVRLYNTGKACFVKEFIHSSQCLIYGSFDHCTKHAAIEPGKWYGMKFILQNVNDGVNLLFYIDYDNGINGGNWQLVLEYTDTNDWWASLDGSGAEDKCMEDCNYNGNENWYTKGNSIFLRNDAVSDYQWKFFSKREIIPLPFNKINDQ